MAEPCVSDGGRPEHPAGAEPARLPAEDRQAYAPDEGPP